MDDITKTIIAVLAGFATAFLAEPVKIWFQNRAKLRDLKVGLYKEMVSNYVLFENLAKDDRRKKASPNYEKFQPSIDDSGMSDDVIRSIVEAAEHDSEISIGIVKGLLRNEYYQRSLKDDMPLFYKLDEAIDINHLYSRVYFVIDALKSDSDSEFVAAGYAIKLYSNSYTETFRRLVYINSFDRGLLIKIMGKSWYKGLFEKGKKEYKKSEDEETEK